MSHSRISLGRRLIKKLYGTLCLSSKVYENLIKYATRSECLLLELWLQCQPYPPPVSSSRRQSELRRQSIPTRVSQKCLFGNFEDPFWNFESISLFHFGLHLFYRSQPGRNTSLHSNDDIWLETTTLTSSFSDCRFVRSFSYCGTDWSGACGGASSHFQDSKYPAEHQQSEVYLGVVHSFNNA